MNVWEPNVRSYPHFDPLISAKIAKSVATDPQKVAQHKFYPFLKYDDRWTPYTAKGIKVKPKTRPIRFAARLDSCIFSYYRHSLSDAYEKRLVAAGLADSILAYRRLPKPLGNAGKCNIDFALSAFERVRAHGDCCAIALDISSFFESLDHDRLKRVWSTLIGQPTLPPDHYKVFKAITRYAFVDVKAAYERLGYFGRKRDSYGQVRDGYLLPKKEIPIQLCSGKEFREKIAGGSGKPTIIQRNPHDRGIPQGAALSDLLANAYLFEFDVHVKQICDRFAGTYYRYSDDILIIAPVDAFTALRLEVEVRNHITAYGSCLEIKEEKSAVHQFTSSRDKQDIRVLKPLSSPNKRFEYLGFRYDGRFVFIRDKTMSGLHRKIVSKCRSTAIRLSRRYQGKTLTEIVSLANIDRLIQSFGAVEDFHAKSDNYRNWTFLTYAKRAMQTLGPLGIPISGQVRNLRKTIETRLLKELVRVCRS
jgi:hypothetical protein